MGEWLLTEHVRESRPLESLLNERARAVRQNAKEIPPDRLRNSSAEAVVEELSAEWSRFAQPLRIASEPMPPGEPDRVHRHDREGPEQHSYWRWAYEVSVSGDLELLERWPAQLESPPVGEHQFHPPAGPFLRSYNDGAVVLYADVLCDQDPDGVLQPAEEVSAAAGLLADLILAANSQLAAYDAELRIELIESISLRQQRLAQIAEGHGVVIELIRKQLEPLRLVEAIAGPTTDVNPVGVGASGPIAVDLQYALHDGSVQDLLGAIRKWREGIEIYPATYTKLDEEDISGLLVTTLNTVFDSAQREVFRSAGKTDIYVQANLGRHDRAAHIAEAKIWRGKGEVEADLAQLLGYANARTTSQVLLYYVRNQDLAVVAERCAGEVLTRSIDSEVETLDRYDFAATVQHPEFRSQIRLSVAFVHIPTSGAVDPDGTAQA